MNPSENNTSYDECFSIKPTKKLRYININEDIVLALTPETLKLYMILRYESDYHQDTSSVDKNIKFLMNKTKFARRQVFYSLNELEENGLLVREANPGFQSTYWVANTLHHYKHAVSQQDIKSTGVVQDTHGVVQDTHGVVRDTHTIITNLFTNSSHKDHSVDFQSTDNYKDDELFMQFYSLYPNKQKPLVARKAFYKHKPDQAFVSMLCEDIKLRIDNNWKNRNKDKIPHPSTYLNGKEWEGEIYKPESNVTNFPVKPPRYTADELGSNLMGCAL